MLRIATIAAGLVMASAAWADVWLDQSGMYHSYSEWVDVPNFGNGTNMIIGGGSYGQPIPVTATLPPKTACEPGWTLVYVGTAHGGSNTAKCAAVGDLRDPE